METIQLTIQEIVKDFYMLAETEGYMSGRAECVDLVQQDMEMYFEFVENMIKKYIPNYKKHLDEKYNKLDLHEKGLELSAILDKNFRTIFYQLV